MKLHLLIIYFKKISRKFPLLEISPVKTQAVMYMSLFKKIEKTSQKKNIPACHKSYQPMTDICFNAQKKREFAHIKSRTKNKNKKLQLFMSATFSAFKALILANFFQNFFHVYCLLNCEDLKFFRFLLVFQTDFCITCLCFCFRNFFELYVKFFLLLQGFSDFFPYSPLDL